MNVRFEKDRLIVTFDPFESALIREICYGDEDNITDWLERLMNDAYEKELRDFLKPPNVNNKLGR